MAVVKVKEIKTTVSKALDYVENPDKTDHQRLVSGYNVDPLTAAIEFRLTAETAKTVLGDHTATGGSNVLAYHVMQSFAPEDNITPEQAHALGKKLADEILDGRYEYVISTHVDTDAIHNHIIFNATSFVDFRKFNYFGKRELPKMRDASDRLCADAGLSVISPNKQYKRQIRAVIDQAIKQSTNFENFMTTMVSMGVTVKEGARISFKITDSDQQRYIRGDRIGSRYSTEGIQKRIQRNARQAQYAAQSLAQMPRWKVQQEINAMARALQTLHVESISDGTELTRRLDALAEQVTAVKAIIDEAEQKVSQYKRAEKYLLAVQKHQEIQELIDHQPAQEQRWAFFRYQKEIEAYRHAVKQLAEMGVDPNVDPSKVRGLIKQQGKEIAELKAGLKSIQNRIRSLQIAQEQADRPRDKEQR